MNDIGGRTMAIATTMRPLKPAFPGPLPGPFLAFFSTSAFQVFCSVSHRALKSSLGGPGCETHQATLPNREAPEGEMEITSIHMPSADETRPPDNTVSARSKHGALLFHLQGPSPWDPWLGASRSPCHPFYSTFTLLTVYSCYKSLF